MRIKRIMLLLLLCIQMSVFAYTPQVTYTSSYTSTVSPTMATAPTQMFGGSAVDEGDGPPSSNWGQPITSDPQEEGDDGDGPPGQNWGQPETSDPQEDDPSPLGSPWPLLLFAVGYALRLRRRSKA